MFSCLGAEGYAIGVDDILAIPDISVEESEDLPRILQPFVEEAANRLAGSKQSSSSPSPEQISEAMSKASQQLQKLRVSKFSILILSQLLCHFPYL